MPWSKSTIWASDRRVGRRASRFASPRRVPQNAEAQLRLLLKYADSINVELTTLIGGGGGLSLGSARASRAGEGASRRELFLARCENQERSQSSFWRGAKPAREARAFPRKTVAPSSPFQVHDTLQSRTRSRIEDVIDSFPKTGLARAQLDSLGFTLHNLYNALETLHPDFPHLRESRERSVALGPRITRKDVPHHSPAPAGGAGKRGLSWPTFLPFGISSAIATN